MPGRSTLWLPVAAVLLGVWGGIGWAQPPRMAPKVVNFNPATPVAGAAPADVPFAIMGEVAKPGVYLGKPRTTLQELVQRAGGLGADAAPNLRVVRQGRAGQRIFFQPQARDEVLPGDVVIVDSTRDRGAMGRVVQATGPTPVAAPAETGVLLAMLGVLDRPVIVRVHREEAELQHIVQMLGQPVEVARTVRVIPGVGMPTAARPTMPGQPVDPRVFLTSGAVLMFDRDKLDPRRLPDFPKAVEWNEIRSSAAVPAPLPVTDPLPLAAIPLSPSTGMSSGDETANRNRIPHSESSHAGQYAQATSMPLPLGTGTFYSQEQKSAPAPPPVVPRKPSPWATDRPQPERPQPDRVAANTPGYRPETRSSMPVIESRMPNPNLSTDRTGPVPPPRDAESAADWKLVPAQRTSATNPSSGSSTSAIPKSAALSLIEMLGILEGVAGLVCIAVMMSRHFDQADRSMTLIPLNPTSPATSPIPPAIAQQQAAAIATPDRITRQLAAHMAPQKAPPTTSENPAATPPISTNPASTSGSESRDTGRSASSRFELLDQLIHNQIPVVEEPWEMPSGMEFHARANVPRIERLDPPEERMKSEHAAPHYLRPPITEPLSRSRLDAAMEFSPAIDATGLSPLERALFHLQGERRP